MKRGWGGEAGDGAKVSQGLPCKDRWDLQLHPPREGMALPSGFSGDEHPGEEEEGCGWSLC